ncbi:MAG: hypothetical protein JXR37_27585 [Kiritimatiellae bacterium]|nr:hypothetical protein [Kiritimatiellia bacterium]
MNGKTLTVSLMVAVCALGIARAEEDRAHALFQRARSEELARNPRAAVASYEELIMNHRAQLPVTAPALMNLVACYQLLKEDPEAAARYAAVAARFLSEPPPLDGVATPNIEQVKEDLLWKPWLANLDVANVPFGKVARQIREQTGTRLLYLASEEDARALIGDPGNVEWMGWHVHRLAPACQPIVERLLARRDGPMVSIKLKDAGPSEVIERLREATGGVELPLRLEDGSSSAIVFLVGPSVAESDLLRKRGLHTPVKQVGGREFRHADAGRFRLALECLDQEARIAGGVRSYAMPMSFWLTASRPEELLAFAGGPVSVEFVTGKTETGSPALPHYPWDRFENWETADTPWSHRHTGEDGSGIAAVSGHVRIALSAGDWHEVTLACTPGEAVRVGEFNVRLKAVKEDGDESCVMIEVAPADFALLPAETDVATASLASRRRLPPPGVVNRCWIEIDDRDCDNGSRVSGRHRGTGASIPPATHGAPSSQVKMAFKKADWSAARRLKLRVAGAVAVREFPFSFERRSGAE